MIKLLDLALFLGGNAFECLESSFDALQEHTLHPILVFTFVLGFQLFLADYLEAELGLCKHSTASTLEGLSLIGFIWCANLSLEVKLATSLLIVGYLLLKQFRAAH